MKIQAKLGTAAGVLLILLLASGAQAATLVFDKTGLQRGTDTGRFPLEILMDGHFKETLPDFEFLAPFDVRAQAILRGKEIVAPPLLGSGMFPTNLLGIAGREWDLGLFRLLDHLDRSRVKFSDEPLPATAVLILVGFVALIALKGRRK